MPKYVLAYHGGNAMPETEAEQAEVMAAWGAWFGELGDAIVDPGNPVGQAKTVAADGSVSDDGGGNPLTGYSLINADNIDAAVTLAQGCPVRANGGHVEVAETLDM